MVVYSSQKLSDENLDLLVRWLTHNYTPSTVPDYANQLDVLNAALAPSSSVAVEAAPKK